MQKKIEYWIIEAKANPKENHQVNQNKEVTVHVGTWRGMNSNPMPAWSQYDITPFNSEEDARKSLELWSRDNGDLYEFKKISGTETIKHVQIAIETSKTEESGVVKETTVTTKITSTVE